MNIKRLTILAFGAFAIPGCLAVDYAIPGGSPRGLSVGDLNGDGHPDVVVGHRPAPDGTGALRGASALLSDGNGGFRHQLVPLFQVFPNKTLLVDLNQDGKLDLVASYPAENGSGGVRVLLGKGGVEFTSAGELQGVGNPVGLAQGDLDGDGYPDLVVSDADPRRAPLQIHRGRGDGTFQLSEQHFAVKPTSEIAIGSLAVAGKLDIALGTSEGTVEVLPGDGRGGFLAPVRRNVGEGRVSVALGDIDKNGILEIIAASEGSRTVTVLPIAHFVVRAPKPHTVTVEASPCGVAVGDADRDGELDVFLVDSEANSLVVLKGHGKAALEAGTPLFAAGKAIQVGKRPTEVQFSDSRGGRVFVVNEEDSSVTLIQPSYIPPSDQ